MKGKITVADVPGPSFLKVLAMYLREHKIIPFPRHQTETFIQWWYCQAAEMLKQFYLHPSLPIQPALTAQHGSSARQLQKTLIWAHTSCLKLLITSGWITQHASSGVMLVSNSAKEKMDLLAEEIQNTNLQLSHEETTLSL